MFDKREYREVFSRVTASEETYRRVLNMTNRAKPRKGGRALMKIVLVAAIVSLLAVTASASESVASWFRGYFANHSDEGLTAEQGMYIEENEQIIEDVQTQDGYTLKLKSAITDGKVAYITIGITGPEDALLNRTKIEGYSTDKPSISFGNKFFDYLKPASGQQVWGSITSGTYEDNDGLDNTQDMLIQLEPAYNAEDGNPLAPGAAWNLHIEDLIAQYVNEAYKKELEEKYPGDNTIIPDEEAKYLFPEVTLAEGAWDFVITFDEFDDREVELISEPVATLACIGFKADGTDVYEEVDITSFTLGALSATIRTDWEGAPDFSNIEENLIYVVMKDESRVALRSSSGSSGEQLLLADSPLILEEVEYVLMADGTKIPVPEMTE